MTHEQISQIVEKYAARTMKECYEITIDDSNNGAPGVLDDKLGGTPYIPIGVDYPTAPDGKPLALLLQVNLKNIDLPNFPKSGILEIFTDADLDYPAECRTFIFEEGQEYCLELPEIDRSLNVTPIPLRIKFKKKAFPMPISNRNSDEIILDIINELSANNPHADYNNSDDELFDSLFDLANPKASIGGYPDFTQSDPRDDDKSFSVCLFKLDAYFHETIDIGDGGILSVMMSEEDLINGNFEKAQIEWDCY